MRPDTGGRVVLEREGPIGEQVVYRTSLYTAGGEWTADATVRVLDGDVTFTAFSPEGEPPWLVTLARAFLRAIWKDRDAPENAWPARINRWRAEPLIRV